MLKMKIFFALLFTAALALPGWTQTTPQYRKDALAILKLQQQVLAVDQAGQTKKAKALYRVESARFEAFSKKYAKYRLRDGPPPSNPLLAMGDTALSQVVKETDPTKKKQGWSQGDSSLTRLRAMIEKGQ